MHDCDAGIKEGADGAPCSGSGEDDKGNATPPNFQNKCDHKFDLALHLMYHA